MALAEEFHIPFFETSAKENIGVQQAFSVLSTEVKNRVLTADGTEEVYKVDAIRLTGEKGKSEGGKCAC
jgi:hypothetical protein